MGRGSQRFGGREVAVIVTLWILLIAITNARAAEPEAFGDSGGAGRMKMKVHGVIEMNNGAQGVIRRVRGVSRAAVYG